MANQYKPKENKIKTGKYYEKIIETIHDDVNALEKEAKLYRDTPKIFLGIMKNLKERREDLSYYQNLAKEYKDEGWTA